MSKKILITGSTDGIGLAAARMLILKGHEVILHGRSEEKMEQAKDIIFKETGKTAVDSYVYDLSELSSVIKFAKNIIDDHEDLDVLINNAGVYNTTKSTTKEGLDVRFAVNTLAPYLLTKKLIFLLGTSGRVINLSSAAQSPVDLDALRGVTKLPNGEAYAQSKLALTMWSRNMALSLKDKGPSIIAVNPKSFIGTKMVKDAYGLEGVDINIGADILARAALSTEFANASGKYFDNDFGRFSIPHPDVFNVKKTERIIVTIEEVIKQFVKDY